MAKSSPVTLEIDYKIKSKKVIKAPKSVMERSQAKGGLQMLDWMASGSPKNNTMPPLKTGFLSGSGSVFLGGKLLDVTESSGTERGKPNKSYQAKDNVLTFGFNTEYAAEVHEVKKAKGQFSGQSGNRQSGNQWVTSHLKSDGKLLSKLIAELIKNDLDKQKI